LQLLIARHKAEYKANQTLRVTQFHANVKRITKYSNSSSDFPLVGGNPVLVVG
jgi:hypothetical protein